MLDWRVLCLQLLPAVLQEFVRLIGIDATMKVVAMYGGTRLRMPLEAKEEHPLDELIGHEKFALLTSRFLGHRFDIPKATAALLHIRNSKIIAEYGPKSTRQLALEHGLTERQIWNIVGKAQVIKSVTPEQNCLFN